MNYISNQRTQQARNIVKGLGLSLPVRKTHSKLFIYIGKQAERLDTDTALELLYTLENKGFNVDMRETMFDMADRGILNQFTVY